MKIPHDKNKNTGKIAISFSVDINTPYNQLMELLNGEINGTPVCSSISHIYIENPFSLMLDNKEERKAKEVRVSSVVGILKEFEIKPVFIFDYTCMGDHHLTADFHKKLGRLMGFLNSVDVTAISVADFYMAEMFSSNFAPYDMFSHFDVYISPHAKINHAIKLKYLDDFDYRMITLHPDLNFNMEEIKKVLKKAGNEKTEILLDPQCITRCPLETFCRALRFHLREEKIDPDEMKTAASYYRDQCRRWLEEDPSLRNQIPVIPPGKIGEYQAMGIKYFRLLNEEGTLEDLKSKLFGYINKYE